MTSGPLLQLSEISQEDDVACLNPSRERQLAVPRPAEKENLIRIEIRQLFWRSSIDRPTPEIVAAVSLNPVNAVRNGLSIR